ncbi:MAG: decaprenyl-phosphate phosphoribosyltransferase [Acidobacteriota bacterium]|nr:decaprenyl-phosphate phosphoribosyltransferase [Acidobacteriota bacterium]MDP3717383.1 decaprenyl-phosphate phosphoribosyltransferase [Acidobacteriota bacterium]
METRSPVANLIISLRPDQWTKNLIVFAALVFAVKLFDPAALALASAAFLIFCALSGSVYLINDVSDREADRLHPLKRLRPIASGALGAGTALGWAIGLSVVALAAAYALRPLFAVAAAAYLALFALYTHTLKHVVILDVMSIAIGFVLRAVAGGLVIGVPVSDWLLVCTILLALFLGLAKRRHEITALADGASGHRRILEEYDPYLLDQMIAIVAAATLVVYIIYCASPDTAERFGTHLLVLTTPFPIYGIFRYLYLVHRKHGGGSPSDLLLRDRPLLSCVALWGIAVVTIIYRPYAS